MIKCIVSDMDGTLFNSKTQVDPKTIEVIKQCQKQGIVFCVASGRDYRSMEDVVNLLELDYAISLNGAIVHDLKHQQTIKEPCFTQSEIQQLLDFAQLVKHDLLFAQGQDAYWYVPEGVTLSQIRKDHIMSWNEHVHMIDKDATQIKEPFRKANMVSNQARLAPILKQFKQSQIPLSAVFSGDDIIDFIGIQTSKGNAVRKLMQLLSINQDEVLVFGDSENDISMLQAVTHSVAMSNAKQHVLDCASDVTDTNDNLGVAKGIRKYIKLEA